MRANAYFQDKLRLLQERFSVVELIESNHNNTVSIVSRTKAA